MANRTDFCNPFVNRFSGKQLIHVKKNVYCNGYQTNVSSFKFIAPRCLDENDSGIKTGVHIGQCNRKPKIYYDGREYDILDFKHNTWPRRVSIWNNSDLRDKLNPRFEYFHVYDIVETTEYADICDSSRFATATRPCGTVITLLGMSQCKKKVAVHVYGVCQYFYMNKVDVDLVCNIQSVTELAGLLAECLRNSTFNTFSNCNANSTESTYYGKMFKFASPESFRIDVVERSDIYYFNTKPSKFYKIYCPSQKIANYLCDNFYPDIKKYEGKVDATTRFLLDNSFTSFGWYKLKPGINGERVRVRPVNKQITLNDVEIDCTPDNLELMSCNDEWPNYKLMCFDIECKSGGVNEMAFPEASNNEDVIIQISCLLYSINTCKLEHILLFSLGSCNLSRDYLDTVAVDKFPEPKVFEFDSEFELLLAFFTFVKQYSPEFATGYNIVNFDWAFIYNKLTCVYDLKLDGYGSLNRGGIFKVWDVGKGGFNHRSKVKINGLISLDMYTIVMDKLKLSNYKLDTVAHEVLKESKKDLSYKDIPKYYSNGPNTRGVIGEYCIQDSLLVGKLFFKFLPHLELAAVAKLARITLTKTIYDGQQIRIYTCLLGLASLRGFILPDGGYSANLNEEIHVSDNDDDITTTKSIHTHNRSVGYKGAKVLDPDTGFHIDPVVVLDFASLYPSIIQAHNLCFTTLAFDIESVKHLGSNDYSVFNVGGQQLFFVHAHIRESLLGVLLKDWLNMRKRIRAQIPNSSAERSVLLDKQQAAIKVVCNSVYGFTGVAQGMLPCLYVAATVTTIGRQMLLSTRDYIHSSLNTREKLKTTFPDVTPYISYENPYKVSVIYGDTDSVFIKFQGVTAQGVSKIGERMAQNITCALFHSPIKLECEKTFTKLLLITKKKYIGVMLNGRVLMKGVELVRKNNCKFINDYASKLVDLLLHNNDVAVAAAEVSRISADKWPGKPLPPGMAAFGCVLADAYYRITSPGLDISDFVMTAELSRPPDAYKNRRIAHLTVYYKIMMRRGRLPNVRERISYVIVAPTNEAEIEAKQISALRGDVQGKNIQRKLLVSDLAEDPVYAAGHGMALNIDYYFSHLLGTASTTFKALFNNDTRLTERLLKRFIPEQFNINVQHCQLLQQAGFVYLRSLWNSTPSNPKNINEEEQSRQIIHKVFYTQEAIPHQN
ncbi:DNA polymerase [Cercopithecine alphaherpesvirus 9]|uniref:DNA polymerase n=1 Tax=Cercopithecine herpesvirus 9 (strain DHV) TaxID=36348 RepID=Q9E1Y8_CHV9D|nr:DNA polymerase catalytic subunit [Cercopithecine alphaherpesvirus 9]AAG27201.1 DNA polymerase [Cercopithecine alphaherpesvirus 9]